MDKIVEIGSVVIHLENENKKRKLEDMVEQNIGFNDEQSLVISKQEIKNLRGHILEKQNKIILIYESTSRDRFLLNTFFNKIILNCINFAIICFIKFFQT